MRRKSASTLSVWAAIVGLWLVVMVAWATQMGLDRWSRHVRQHETPIDYWLKRDPAPGTRVSLPERDVYGKPIAVEDSDQEDVLLIVAGNCGGCTKSKLNPKKLDTSSFKQVIILFTSKEEDVLKTKFDFAKNVRVVAGLDVARTHNLNAFYMPRFYLLDRRLQVRKTQQGPGDQPDWYLRAMPVAEEAE